LPGLSRRRLLGAALVLLLAVLGRRTKRLAALVGGAGFGLFIDELGKFTTSDNNYFFQPTIALIYTILIGLFLVFRAIERPSRSTQEVQANAAELLREVFLGGATEAEIRGTLHLLERASVEPELLRALHLVIAGAARASENGPSRLSGAATRVRKLYDAFIMWRWFQRVVIVLFVLQAVLGLLLVAVLMVAVIVVAMPAVALGQLPDPSEILQSDSSIGLAGAAASTVSGALSLVCVMVGVARLRRSRLGAYRWLERSVLVSIFFGQVLLFWEQELAAIGQLAWNLLLVAALQYAIRQEELGARPSRALSSD